MRLQVGKLCDIVPAGALAHMRALPCATLPHPPVQRRVEVGQEGPHAALAAHVAVGGLWGREGRGSRKLKGHAATSLAC